jgi:para-aminobenzoate synthetase component I
LVNFHAERELGRFEWRRGDHTDPLTDLEEFLSRAGFRVDDLASPRPYARPDRYAVLLVGAAAAATAAGADPGPPSPVPAVPDLAVVVRERTTTAARHAPARVELGEWTCTWTDADHAAAVRSVRAAIGRGDVYQVNVVGHRAAPYDGDPTPVLAAVTALPGATHARTLHGDGWAVATASPECLLSVTAGTARTHPIKGTRPATAAGHRELLADPKERAEHVMIVDLARNDLGRVAAPGTVHVEHLFTPRRWCGLWQAESTVAARLRPHVGLAELLRAVLPGGSVTGAPKLAALAHVARLEPVGRGPAMGALGVLTDQHLDLGLTIRTVAADRSALHLWAGGGITWSSDPDREVAEAHAKAAPLLATARRATNPHAAPHHPNPGSGSSPPRHGAARP